MLTVETVIQRWPKLYHMAEAGSWSSVQRHGLLSTSALLDFFEVAGDHRFAIESMRRPKSVIITRPVHGTAVIRDNKPVNEMVLKRTLVGMTLEEWYRTLNGRVFFWLSERRLGKLLSAAAYRTRQHDILTVDTATLLERYGDQVELSPMNSGAVHAGANYPRGSGTFCAIGDYPWRDRLKVNPSEPVVELTVPYAVPDIAKYVIDVTTR